MPAFFGMTAVVDFLLVDAARSHDGFTHAMDNLLVGWANRCEATS
jgi:hypothetical protein